VPRVTFTGNLQRFVDCPPAEVAGSTVRESLEAVFAKNRVCADTCWTTRARCAGT